MDPEQVEVNKLLVVSEFKISSLGCTDTDGAVILDDAVMQVFGEGGEEL
jgi:hypothetical protein